MDSMSYFVESVAFPNKCKVELLSQRAIQAVFAAHSVSGGLYVGHAVTREAFLRDLIKEVPKQLCKDVWSKVCCAIPYVAGAVIVVGVCYYILKKNQKNGEVTVSKIEMDDLKEENAKLKETLNQIMKENAALKKDNAEMKEELTAVRKENAEMKEELTAVRKENGEMKTKMDKMQTTMDKVQEQNADIKEQNADIKNEVAELKGMLASMMAQNKENGGNK